VPCEATASEPSEGAESETFSLDAAAATGT
jgi:hypothetical protein